MKKSNRAFLLTAIVIFSLFIIVAVTSCTNKKPDSASNTNTADNITGGNNGEESAQEKSIFDILPKNNFNGDKFVIYIPPNNDSPVDKGTFAEELTGEVFNDAVYNRNLKVENEYNVKIKPVYGVQWDSTFGDLKKDVAAGDLRADVYFTHSYLGVASIASSGFLREWTAVPQLDFAKPWWNQSIIKNLSIANRTFYISGSMSIQDTTVLTFNKTMLQELGLENPYTLVREGKWTLDKLNELAVAATADLNGDGKYKANDDRFGLEFGISWQTPSFMFACDEITVTLDENGYPAVTMTNQKKIDMFDKVYTLLRDGNKTNCYFGNFPAIGIDSGRVLFCQYTLFICEPLRAAEVDYGILPMPKYDENQEKYISNSWTGIYGLPVIIPDERLAIIGTVMEAMSALGHKDVIPVYYDILLKEKISRDDDSRDMLDIILNGMVYDAGFSYQVGASQPGHFIARLIESKKKNYMSEIEKSIDKMIADFDDFYNKILEVGR